MSQTIPHVLGEATIQELRETVRGQIVTPSDPDYAEASRIWNGAHDGRREPELLFCQGLVQGQDRAQRSLCPPRRSHQCHREVSSPAGDRRSQRPPMIMRSRLRSALWVVLYS